MYRTVDFSKNSVRNLIHYFQYMKQIKATSPYINYILHIVKKIFLKKN